MSTSLISVEELQQAKDTAKQVLLFVYGLKKSAADLSVQIPGSRHFDLKNTFRDTNNPLPNTLPSPEVFSAGCRDLGINGDTEVVLYDASGVYASPRAYFLFKAMGHDKVRLLNGGLPAWQAAGLPTEAFQAHPPDKPGNFQASLQQKRVKYLKDITANLERDQFLVVDARSTGRFEGTAPEPRAGLPSGHLPGASNLPFTEVLEDGMFKNQEQLAEIFSELKQDKRPKVYSCGSGITACITMLAAEQVLEDDSWSVYDGSWTEYASDGSYPIHSKQQS